MPSVVWCMLLWGVGCNSLDWILVGPFALAFIWRFCLTPSLILGWHPSWSLYCLKERKLKDGSANRLIWPRGKTQWEKVPWLVDLIEYLLLLGFSFEGNSCDDGAWVEEITVLNACVQWWDTLVCIHRICNQNSMMCVRRVMMGVFRSKCST